jgi:hypothetical protein
MYEFRKYVLNIGAHFPLLFCVIKGMQAKGRYPLQDYPIYPRDTSLCSLNMRFIPVVFC